MNTEVRNQEKVLRLNQDQLATALRLPLDHEIQIENEKPSELELFRQNLDALDEIHNRFAFLMGEIKDLIRR